MEKSDNNKEINLNEVAITLEVDSSLIEQVRSGEITHLVLQIDESNQKSGKWHFRWFRRCQCHHSKTEKI